MTLGKHTSHNTYKSMEYRSQQGKQKSDAKSSDPSKYNYIARIVHVLHCHIRLSVYSSQQINPLFFTFGDTHIPIIHPLSTYSN